VSNLFSLLSLLHKGPLDFCWAAIRLIMGNLFVLFSFNFCIRTFRYARNNILVTI